jgi:hypothetical protein
LSEALDCEGAPRDLGLDQGRACAQALRRRFAGLGFASRARLRLGRGGAATRQLARELARHLPHQFETLQGLARGARVPALWLLEELAAELAREAQARPLALASAAPALLARTVDGPWLLRRSRPEGLFASLELARPWRSGALAGVNERGLAALALAGAAGAGGPPAALLVQDCLERFETLEGALAWCGHRPAGGRALLFFADARGEAAALEIEGAQRRVLRPSAGALAAGGAAGAAAELVKRLAEAAPADAAQLAALCPQPAVALDPARRSLALQGRVTSL